VRELIPTSIRKPTSSSETLLFYLRLAPGRALKLTAVPDEPSPPTQPPPIDRSARTASTMAEAR
jgi:hypothetical protein